ncbi:MAG: hypothetical protein A2X49_17065 [Lentisphaerae bacterium GWF2_52_8]|nr:MAG: hypothetical protein A2X49_17065 [Lentisphaerae bacterium GWF2_52_8]
MSTNRKKLAFACLAIFMGILFALLSAELGVRLFLPSRGMNPMNYKVTGKGYRAYKPETSFKVVNEAMENIVVSADKRGFRNPEGAELEAEAILLGDSFIAAVNTPDGATLADVLRSAGLKVYNCGIDGAGSFEELAATRDILPLAPKARILILFFYLGNDFRDNYFTIPEALGAAAKEPKKSLTNKVFGRSALFRVLHECLYLFKVWKKGSLDLMESYPLAETMSLMDAPPKEFLLAEKRTAAYLALFKDEARERGVEALVVGIPSKAQTIKNFKAISRFDCDPKAQKLAKTAEKEGFSFDAPDHRLSELCKKANLDYISLLPLFREKQNDGIFYEKDMHWTGKGQAVTASFLMPELLTRMGPSAKTGK